MKNFSVIAWGIGILLVVGLIAWIATAGSSQTANTTKPDLALQSNDHVRGASNPKVVLIEYGDFQCPACGAIEPTVQQLLAAYPNELAVAYRHFPLRSIHPNADNAAKASEAASLQGKFWEMHDKLYATQAMWSASSEAFAIFKQYGSELGLDMNKFSSDFTAPAVMNTVSSGYNGAIALGLNSTPTFFLNGKKLTQIPGNLNAFKQLIDAELAQ